MPSLMRKEPIADHTRDTMDYNILSAELVYEQSNAAVQLLVKEEELRKTRLRLQLVCSENDDLNDSLLAEADRADQAQQSAESWQSTSEEAEAELQRTRNELRIKLRELDGLKAELDSVQFTTNDSSKLLTEKLSLTRELATVKPELDHLREQNSMNANLLAEKLSLQRQVASLQTELEDSQRQTSRLQKQAGKGTGDTRLHDELDELREELAREKRERSKAEKAVAKAMSQGQPRVEGNAIEEIANLKADLETARKERLKSDRLHQKAMSDFSAQKALLDEKLDQFRNKLRSTKDTLKHTQEELAVAQQQAASAALSTNSSAGRGTTNPRKRPAATDPDASIGTPGDLGPAAKRNKRASSIVTSLGEKSTFSITPLLKRTKNLVTDISKPDKRVAPAALSSSIAQDADVPLPSIEPASVAGSDDEHDGDADPVRSRDEADQTSSGSKKSRPLALSSPGKANLTARSKSTSGAAARKNQGLKPSKLDIVVEEEGHHNSVDENEATTKNQAQPETEPEPQKKTIKPRLSLKPKSLSSFTSFREGSLQPALSLGSLNAFGSGAGQVKKTRKLGGARTIFDEDGEVDGDEDDGGNGNGGVFSKKTQRAFGAFAPGATGLRAFGALAGSKIKTKGALVTMGDGFAFSPLRKERRAVV